MRWFIPLFFFLSQFTFAQHSKDSIILLNGKVFRGDIDRANDEVIFYYEEDRNGEFALQEMFTYRVFSYTWDDKETVIYQQDELKGDFLTVGEARNATLGSYDAREMYKPRFVFWSSLALGLGASVFDTYLTEAQANDPDLIQPLNDGFFGKNPSVFPFLVPVVLSASWGLPTFKVKRKRMLQEDLFGDELYYRGYHRIAKQRRIFAALKGSFIGIGTGMLAYGIFKIN